MTASLPASPALSPVPNPRLVLRVGFAGKRELHPPDKNRPNMGESEIRKPTAEIQQRLVEVFRVIGKELIEIAPHTPCQAGRAPVIATYFAKQNPLLRVVTGLCEGADTLAYQASEQLNLDCLEVENAAVIGFPIESYRGSRETAFLEEFDRQARGSAYVLQADGILEDGDSGKFKRIRGYRCQSDLLLRQSDLLVALVDPTEEGKAGGTLETVHKALHFQLPVVLIHPGSDQIRIIAPAGNLADEVESEGDPNWQEKLRRWIRRIVADPRLAEDAFEDEQSSHGRDLLDEFFSGEMPAPLAYDDGPTWSAFETWFKPRHPEASGASSNHGDDHQPRCDAFLRYRKRATELSRCYARRYRNAFFRNALFALCAVLLAAASLLLLALSGGHPHSPMITVLIILAVLKLGLVVKIYLTAHEANHHHWNDRAVDYRYLAERLRAMDFLPEAGIWQPPAAASPQYASRVVRQSAADWLLDALMRHVSPAGWADPQRLITLDPTATLKSVRDHWLTNQLHYHKDAALKMQRMELWLRTLGELLNFAVIAIVAIDILLLLVKLVLTSLETSEHLAHQLAVAAPFIVYITAVIPAAVAAVNIIRFQSECERLAKRSAVMVRMLGGRRITPAAEASGVHHEVPHASGHGTSHDKVMRFLSEIGQKLLILKNPSGPPAPATNASPTEGGRIHEAEALLALLQSPREQQLGCATGKVLHFTEGCAEIFVQEVAEWSVLYAKELVEP